MTNALEITNSPIAINGLDVVRQVDEFYSSAFDHLLWVLGTLILLLGIAVPVIFYFFQKRQLAFREKMLADELKNQFTDLSSSLRKENSDFMDKEKIALKLELEDLEKKVQRKSADLASAIFYTQATSFLEKGVTTTAFALFVKTLTFGVKTENPVNVQNALKFITNFALPKMTKSDFGDMTFVTEFENAIEAAAKMESKGLLDVDVKEVKKAFAEAKKRDKN
jgi:hypothetical protein